MRTLKIVVAAAWAALLTFAIAAWWRSGIALADTPDLLHGWLSEFGVLRAGLVYLPFDAVSYGCGLTSMSQRDFAIGTFLGILPGLISFVLLGGSAAPGVESRLLVLLGAVVFFVLGLVIARWLRASAPAAADP